MANAASRARMVGPVVLDVLRTMQLQSSYGDEQKDLQPEVKGKIEKALELRWEERFETVISVNGKNKPNIKAFGTSFWPDVEVRENGTPLVGVEVKRIAQGNAPSKPIAEAIGQGALYRVRYPYVIVFVVHYGGSEDGNLHDEDEPIHDWLADANIHLLRRVEA